MEGRSLLVEVDMRTDITTVMVWLTLRIATPRTNHRGPSQV